MSEIRITRKHKLSAKKAHAAAGHVAADLQQEFNLEYHWNEEGVLCFRRPGLHGTLTLAKGSVTVKVHLGLLFVAFRAALEREIHDYFDQRFA